MIALRTYFMGPTNTKGARITCDDGNGRRVTVSYDHALPRDEVHIPAVLAFIEKFQLRVRGEFVGGGYNQDFMFWVIDSPHSPRVNVDTDR